MKKAVIFDMDGTMVDNASVHKTAWIEYCRSKGVYISINDFEKIGFGLTSEHYIRTFIKNDASSEEINIMDKEKEALYRELYKPNIKAVKGLYELLVSLKNSGLKTAVATSAIPENLNFVLHELQIISFFDSLVDITQICHPKPDPEIYIKAAKKLNVNPSDCIVFEDSRFGIQAAHEAGMKVIAVNTDKKSEKLTHALKIINDFTQISVNDIITILN